MHTYSFMINAAISMRNFWIKSRIPFFSCPNDQKQHLCNECVKHINNLGGSFQEQQTKIGGRVYSVALVLRDIIWFLVPEITMDLCNCEWFLSALLDRSMKWKWAVLHENLKICAQKCQFCCCKKSCGFSLCVCREGGFWLLTFSSLLTCPLLPVNLPGKKHQTKSEILSHLTLTQYEHLLVDDTSNRRLIAYL